MSDFPNILAIETSCDETAAAVTNGRHILSNVISTQIPEHTLYGGVVPEIASRKHLERINQVIKESLNNSDMTLDDIDAVAVTSGPGLVGALLVGVAEAKAIAFARGLPIIGVHHISGHVSANYIEHEDLKPPFVCLVVSGGHTHLLEVTDYGVYNILAKSVDDAAGEAFDKVARAIGLGYPGGPKIEKAALEGDENAITLPRPRTKDGYDYSFSGLKSAVLNYINAMNMKGEPYNNNDIAASFQKAVVDTLIEHALSAIRDRGIKRFAIAGGVASNQYFRKSIEAACKDAGVDFYYPSPIFCTDNAAMIGVAAGYEYLKGKRDDWSLNAVANLSLESDRIK